MKKHRLTLIILAVLTAIAVFFIISRTKGTFKRELSEFAIYDTISVVKVFLADKNDNTILLERQPDGGWIVNEKYVARKDMVDLLLSTLLNIKVKAPVPKAAFNTVVGNLSARSTKVEIYQRKYLIDLFYRIRLFPRVKLTRVYYVGDVTPDNIGTHMILENSNMPFIVYWPGFWGFIASRYSTKLTDWRDHTIFKHKFLQIDNVELFFPAKSEHSFRVVNNKKGSMDLIPYHQTLPVTEYDTLKMLGFISAFEDIRYEALIDDMDQTIVDSITASQPLHIITLTDVQGNRKQVKTFYRRSYYDENGPERPSEFDTERMYALINNDQDFVLIQHRTFNRIIRPLNFFLPNDK
ncbi:MAG: hypothetical protein GX128_02830 [Bacteroidales bacterium]|jgi:hypothetical protein|nr:hypothetical protein [Bacteroidales bacterium]